MRTPDDRVEKLTRGQATVLVLSVQMYAAMQLLQGDDLRDFWQLVDEIQQCRDLLRSGAV